MSIFKSSGTRKNTKISFRTDDETLDQLKSICRIENRTISSLIESVLTEYVLIHENGSQADQEKRLSPRKKCSIPAVILADKNNQKSYFNCLIKSLSANSAQLVLKKIPDDVFSLFNVGMVYLEEKKFKKSFSCFEKVLKYQPQNAISWYGMAKHYYIKGEFNDAVEHYKKSLKINPDNIHASNELALCFVQLGEFSNAVKLFKKVLK
ncbi:MAG: tetratricopeptide repeat protein, partial [Candidatus Moranbacteria bacterium]|nr:tetratricopeptide repeat protein [Candidatus Moranbacteria bacterium]